MLKNLLFLIFLLCHLTKSKRNFDEKDTSFGVDAIKVNTIKLLMLWFSAISNILSFGIFVASIIETKSCHNSNFVSSVASEDKVGTMTNLSFSYINTNI